MPVTKAACRIFSLSVGVLAIDHADFYCNESLADIKPLTYLDSTLVNWLLQATIPLSGVDVANW